MASTPPTSTNAVASSSKRSAASLLASPSTSSTSPSSSSSFKKPRLDGVGLSESPPLTKSPKYWYSDGNLVLHVESTEFKVHRSLLEGSSVFKDLLLVGDGNGEHSSIDHDENAVVVKLDDESETWQYALQAIYDGFEFRDKPPTGKSLIDLVVLCEKYALDWIFAYCRTIFRDVYIIEIDHAFGGLWQNRRSEPRMPRGEVLKIVYQIAARFPAESEHLPKIFYLLATSSRDLTPFVKSETFPDGMDIKDVLRIHRILQTGLSYQRDMAANFDPADAAYHSASSGCRGVEGAACLKAATSRWTTEWRPFYASSELRFRSLVMVPEAHLWKTCGVREPCVTLMLKEWDRRLKEFDATL